MAHAHYGKKLKGTKAMVSKSVKTPKGKKVKVKKRMKY